MQEIYLVFNVQPTNHSCSLSSAFLFLIITVVSAGVSVWQSLSHVTHHGHHHHLHELTVFITSTMFFLPVTMFFLPANALIFSPFSLCFFLIMLLLHLGHHIHLHYFPHVTHTRLTLQSIHSLFVAAGSMANSSLENTLVRQ